MAKLLRKKKKFGRCRVPGHGSNCEVAHEIQSVPVTRSQDKLDIKKEIKEQLED